MMKYVLIMLISTAGSSGWTTTTIKQEFSSLDSCKQTYITWKLALGAKFLGGDCAKL